MALTKRELQIFEMKETVGKNLGVVYTRKDLKANLQKSMTKMITRQAFLLIIIIF